MRTRAFFLAAALLAAGPAQAGDREFRQVVAKLTDHYKTTPMGTGFLGFLMRCFSPSGIHGLHMAIFEHVKGAGKPLGGEFDAFLKSAVGPDFALMVQVRSNRGGERTCIYAREVRGGIEMLIVSAETDEAVVLDMRVNPETLARWIEDPGGMTRRVGKR